MDKGRGALVLGLFGTPEELVAAARDLRQRGYNRLDALSPFPIHDLDQVLGLGRSRLGLLAFAAGMAGVGCALLLQWWTSAVDYPLVIGGKPYFAIEVSVPVAFELGVLFAALATVGGMLAFSGLPRLYHPALTSELAGAESDDGFVLVVEADPEEREKLAALLTTLGARQVDKVEAEA